MADKKKTKVEDRVARAIKNTWGEATTWDELGIVEDETGALLLPVELRKRTKDGGVKGQAAMLRPLENRQKISARKRAREWFEELALDYEKDKDFFDELENYQLLAFALRDADPPHLQHEYDAKALFDRYSSGELMSTFERLQQWTDVCDPRYGDLEAKEMWEVIQRIARDGNPSFLAGMRSFEQLTCITFMAQEASRSPRAPWSPQPPRTSD